MRLRSALEDFTQTTLGSLKGNLPRLRYLGGLRSGPGYLHWGMVRVHGEEAAQTAMAQAHAAIFLQVLRTPLSKLWQENADPEVERWETEVAPVEDDITRLVPQDLGGGSELHLRSVLFALQSLAQADARAGHQAA